MGEEDQSAMKANLNLLKEMGAKLFIHESLVPWLKAAGMWDDEVCVVVAPIPVSEDE